MREPSLVSNKGADWNVKKSPGDCRGFCRFRTGLVFALAAGFSGLKILDILIKVMRNELGGVEFSPENLEAYKFAKEVFGVHLAAGQSDYPAAVKGSFLDTNIPELCRVGVLEACLNSDLNLVDYCLCGGDCLLTNHSFGIETSGGQEDCRNSGDSKRHKWFLQ